MFQRWEDRLLEVDSGWYKMTELCELLDPVTPETFGRQWVTPFLDYVNKRDRLTLTRNNGNGVRRFHLENGNTAADRYRAKVPDEYHDVFDHCVNYGRSPSAVAAAIRYVTTEQTQAKCAATCDTSEVSLRNVRDWIQDEGLMPELQTGEIS